MKNNHKIETRSRILTSVLFAVLFLSLTVSLVSGSYSNPSLPIDEGFEDWNVLGWDDISGIEINAGDAISGSLGLRLNGTASNPNDGGYLGRVCNGGIEDAIFNQTLEFDVRFNQLRFDTGVNNFQDLYTADSYYTGYIMVIGVWTTDNNNFYWAIESALPYAHGDPEDWIQFTDLDPIELDRVYHVRYDFVLSQTEGISKLYIDDELIYDLNSTDTYYTEYGDNWGIDLEFWFGWASGWQFGSGSSDISLDNISLVDYYPFVAGSEGSGPQWTGAGWTELLLGILGFVFIGGSWVWLKIYWSSDLPTALGGWLCFIVVGFGLVTVMVS